MQRIKFNDGIKGKILRHIDLSSALFLGLAAYWENKGLCKKEVTPSGLYCFVR